MFIVCVTSWVQPDRREDYIAACERNAGLTRREPGNLRFDLLCSAEDPNQFFFYEVYRAEEDFKSHHATEHYLQWRDTVTPWMTQPREGIKYNSVSPAGEDANW